MRSPGDLLYRLILFAFPAPFRQRHGAGMEEHFRSQRRSLAGRPVALGLLWARGITDAVGHGLALRAASRTRGDTAMAFTRDLKYAARGLGRDRAGTAIIVLILTAGIAANAIMFGVVDQLLLRPRSGVGHAAAVRRVYFGSARPRRAASAAADRNSYPYVAAVRDHVAAFQAAAATSLFTDLTLGAGAGARQATVELVDADYFPLLELHPAAGRFFTRADNTPPDGSPVAVLSESFWRREYAGDPGVVGRQIRVEGSLLTIVGVGPSGFAGIEDQPVDVWVPIAALAPALLGNGWATNPGRFAFGLVARVSPDATPALVDAQATAAYRAAIAELPMPMMGPLATASTAPLEGLGAPNGIPAVGKVGLWLLGVAVVVLLVAVANVAGLLLTRTLSRRREIAVRLALGVSRPRLFRQLLTESALLTALAVAVALAVARLGGQLVQQLLLPGFAWDGGVVDGRVLAVTLATSVLAALGAGVAPAFRGLSTDLNASLRTASRVSGGRIGGLRTGLLVVQVALSVVLLVGAGLFVRSLAAVRGRDVGIDLDRIIQVALPLRPGVPMAAVEAQYAQAEERLRAMPGVGSLTLARASAPKAGSNGVSVLPEGWDLTDLNGHPSPALFVVEPDYFATIGASLERGRGLTVEDARAGDRVAVINDAMAAEFWSGSDPVGRCIKVGSDPGCTRIVGVVENIFLFSRVKTDQPQLYIQPSHPFAAGREPRALLIRAAGDARALVPAIRAVVQSLAPDMPFVPVNTLATLAAPELQPWQLGSTMFLLFGAVALFISAVGVYGAMSHTVSQRSHEIGVRMALGASRWHVVSRIARRGAATVSAGTALGLLLAFGATRGLQDLFYQTSPRDPVVFTTVAVVLTIAGVAAAIVPARRSAAVDPLIVLRTE